MKLIADWKWIVKHAWSLRLIALAAVLSGAEVALAVMTAFSVSTRMPAGVFALLSGLVTVAAVPARLFAQRRPTK